MPNPPPVPTVTVAFTTGLDQPTPVLTFGSAGASVTQTAVTQFPVTGFTFSCWICASQTTSGAVLVSYGAATPASRFWIKSPASLEIGIGTQSTGATTVSVADSLWHYIALTVAPSAANTWAVTLYKDGVAVWAGRSAITNATAPQAGGDFVIGTGIAPEPTFVGQLSEVRLLNVVQSANDVMTGMQVRMATNDPTAVIVWALTAAETAGTLAGSYSFAQSQPALQFRINRALQASFTSSGTGATYDLVWTSSDGVYHAPLTGLPLASVVYPSPLINVTYSAAARATLSGETSAWSAPASVLTLDLAQPLTTLAQPTAGHVSLSWQACDQANGYSLLFYQNGGSSPVTPSGSTTNTSFDLSSVVNGTDSWTYTVNSTYGAASGPPSAVTAVTAPTLTFSYDWVTGILGASWTNADGALFRYLTVQQTGASGNAVASLLPASASSYSVPSPAVDQTYTAQIRALQTGAIGAWSTTATVVVHQISAPVISSAVGDGAAHTITAQWTAASGGPANPVFIAELWSGDGATLVASATPAVSPQVFTNSAIVDGSSFEVRVRAAADNSYGQWSQWQPVAINSVGKVVGVDARSDPSGNVTVTWSAVTGFTGVTYTVTISGNGVNYSVADITGTTARLDATNTKVQQGKTYAVTVKASVTGHADGPSSDPFNVTIQQNSVPTGPAGESADPINVATGALTYQNDEIAIAGVLTLTFTVFYSSSRPIAAENPLFSGLPIGNRWSHSFNTQIVPDPSGTKVWLLWGSGEVEAFSVPSSVTGTYPNTGAAPGESLAMGADLFYTLTTPDQTSYRFDNSGALQSITDKYGRQIVLAYASGQLQTVTDASTGRKLTLTYTGTYLQKVQDDNSRSVVFDYNGGDLKQITDTTGNTRVFTYQSPSLMQTLVDARGNTAFKNIYTNNQVTFQQDARALTNKATYGTTFKYENINAGGVAQIQTTVTDRMNNTIVYTSLESNHALLSTTWSLPNGIIQVESATYDAFNNVLTRTVYRGPSASWTAGAGSTTTYTYDGNGNLLTTTVPLSGTTVYVITNTYDGFNNLQTQRVYEGLASGYSATAGNLTTYYYNSDNTLQKIVDPFNRTVQMTYWPGAPAGLLKTMTDVLGNTFSFTFSNGLPQTITDPHGNTITFQFDMVGRLQQTQVTDSTRAVLKTIASTYYANSQLKTTSVMFDAQPTADAFVTGYFYDQNGNLQTYTDCTGTVITYVNDPNNLPTSATWPSWRSSARSLQYKYDNNDDLNTVTFAPGIVDTYTYDSMQGLVTYVDPNQNTYKYVSAQILTGSAAYTSAQTTTLPALAAELGVTYTDVVTTDPLSRVTAIQDRSGNLTQIAYTTQSDATTGTIQSVQTITLPPATGGAASYTITRVYDAVGRIVSVTDQSGGVTTFEYEVETRPSNQSVYVCTVTDAVENQVTSTYDSLGREIERFKGTTSPYKDTQWTYDALGRILTVTEQEEGTSAVTNYSYGWDATTKCVSVSVGRPGTQTGATTQLYNGLLQLVTQIDGSSARTTRTYSPWGALASYTNGRNQTFVYNFDPAARLQQIQLPDSSTVTQICDSNGNRTTTRVGNQAAITRTFDEWNRLATRVDAVTGTVGYKWWPTGQMKTLTYTDQKTVQYVIDGLQRLFTVTDWATRVTTYTYRPTGQVTGITFPNGATASYRYDNAGQFTGYTHTSQGFIVAQWDAVLNALGQPHTATAILPLPPTFPTNNQSFDYLAGNEINTINGAQQSYDADGEWQGPASQSPQMTYDSYGRVSGAQITRNDQYTYDPDGLRTQAILGGTAYNLVYDVNSFSSPLTERGDPTRATIAAEWRATPNGESVVLPIARGSSSLQPISAAIDRLLEIRDSTQAIQQRVVHGLGAILHETASGGYHVLHDDQVGSIIALTDQNGVITDRYNYDPYGQSFGEDGTTFNVFRYGGREGVIDDGAGLLYARARTYSPTQMRWLQPDYFLGCAPWPQTLNSYAYSDGNPLQFSDPLGLSRTAIIVGAALGGAVVLGGAIATIGYFAGWFSGAAAAGGAAAGGAAALAGAAEPLLAEGAGAYELDEMAANAGKESPPSTPRPGMPETPPGMTQINAWEAEGFSGNRLIFRGGRARLPMTSSGGGTASLISETIYDL